jgi:hypothetical protein
MTVQWIRRVGQRAIRGALRPLLRWTPLDDPEPGFSIVVSAPWALRHLLPVNLHFIERTDRRELRRVHVVFDRLPRPGGEAFVERMEAAFPALPLAFRFYPRAAGRVAERVDTSAVYHALCTVLGLGDCRTRYAVLHDFDLYPLVPNYFTEIVRALKERDLRFSGVQLTRFDGLTERDRILGTWALGIDAGWLRSTCRPVDCFHRHARLGGRLIALEPYAWLQSRTPQRDRVGTLGEASFSHVYNLASSYLQLAHGRRILVSWRLHFLWYLEYLAGRPERLVEAMASMEGATGPELAVDGLRADFSKVHVTCANVLRKSVEPMEAALFGSMRDRVRQYLDAADVFLNRFGSHAALTQASDRSERGL